MRRFGARPAGDLVGVVTFADVASTVAAPSGDRGLALAAVDAADAGFGPTRYRAALNHAAQVLNGRPGTIVVVTDLQESGWDAGDRAEVPESVRIEIADVGAAPANLAVMAVRVVKDRIVATVRNAGPDSARGARAALDRRPARRGGIDHDWAGQTADVTLPGGSGTTASVSVDDRGRRAGRQRALPRARRREPALGARRDRGRRSRARGVLRATGAGGGRRRWCASIASPRASGAQVSTWDRARLGEHAAVLLLSTRGLERSGRERAGRSTRDGRRRLPGSGPGRRRRGSGRCARRLVHAGRSAGSRRPPGTVRRAGVRAARPPSSDFSGLRIGIGRSRPRDVRTDCRPSRRTAVSRSPGSRPARRRSSSVLRARDGRSCWRRISIDSGTISRGMRRSFPFCTRRISYLAGPRPRGGRISRSVRHRPGCRRGQESRRWPAPGGGITAPRGRERRSGGGRSRAPDGGGISDRRDADAGDGAVATRRRGPPAGGSAAPLAVRAGRDAAGDARGELRGGKDGVARDSGDPAPEAPAAGRGRCRHVGSAATHRATTA